MARRAASRPWRWSIPSLRVLARGSSKRRLQVRGSLRNAHPTDKEIDTCPIRLQSPSALRGQSPPLSTAVERAQPVPDHLANPVRVPLFPRTVAMSPRGQTLFLRGPRAGLKAPLPLVNGVEAVEVVAGGPLRPEQPVLQAQKVRK